jgi:tetratricopeptide (TPR) repeat protein
MKTIALIGTIVLAWPLESMSEAATTNGTRHSRLSKSTSLLSDFTSEEQALLNKGQTMEICAPNQHSGHSITQISKTRDGKNATPVLLFVFGMEDVEPARREGESMAESHYSRFQAEQFLYLEGWDKYHDRFFTRAYVQEGENAYDHKAAELAAEQGDPVGQANLGLLYAEGRGIPQDYRKAAELYQKAGDQGNALAQVNLGWLYHEGKGVPQDYRKAVELFQKAADQGYVPGQAYLASQYAKGTGVPKDYQKAVELYHKAVNQEPHPNALNDFAWFLATCPDDSQRNGKLAVTYATKACELSEWKQANFVGTLAAAYAEIGDFDAAVKYQKQAIAIGSDYPDKQVMEKALKMYQQRKPYRE